MGWDANCDRKRAHGDEETKNKCMPFGPTYCKFAGGLRRINCGAVYVEISSRPETGQNHMTVPHHHRGVWIPRTITTDVAHKSNCFSLICFE